jgi:hypothetical protein
MIRASTDAMATLAGEFTHVGVRIVLFVNLDSEERFEDVLERDHAGEGAELVDHHREVLMRAGANTVISEEGESGIALARRVLERRGLEPEQIEKLLSAVRRIWSMNLERT